MRHVLPAAIAAALGSACATLSWAQPTEEPGKAFALEEIIVTANRHEQNLQEVAMSVTAFAEDFFQDTGVTDLGGLEQYTPNLTITSSTGTASTSIRIRGIGSVGTNVGIDPSVGMFIDGVYQGRTGMSFSDLIDIARVEVLRGPQGTLYGKNTAAGAISIITNKPSASLEGMGELTYANHNRLELRGMINIPFGDSSNAMRLSGFAVQGDHLFENTFNGQDLNDANKWGLRSRFLFDTDSAGEWVLSLDYSEEDTECCALAVMDYEGLSTLNAPLTNTPSAQWQKELGLNDLGQPILQYIAFEDSEGFSPPPADPFGDDYWFDKEITNEVKVGGAGLEWNYDLDNGDTITFINAWRKYQSLNVYDGDFTAYDSAGGHSDTDLDQFSSELRIHSSRNDKIEGQAGLYAYYSELDSQGSLFQGAPLTNNIGLGLFFPDGSVNYDDNLYTTTSFAAFGQLTWHIAEQWSATLGLRYTYEQKEREGTQITEPTSIIDIPPIAGPDIVYDEKRSDSDVSPAINLRYFVNPDLMTYASISRGFKSGGFNQRREVAGSNGEFDEEIATNYELGWKGTWLDRRLMLNGTLFFVEYDDFQSQSFDGASIKVTNAGTMESYGGEVEVTYLALENLMLGSAIGYTKAEYKEFDNGQCTVEGSFVQHYIVNGAQGLAPAFAPCVQDLSGEPLDNSPEWTVSSYVQYDHNFKADLVGVVRLEHSFIDSHYLDVDLDPKLVNDEVNLINLRLSLAPNDVQWELALWGRNLLDEEYYAIGMDIPTVGGYGGAVAPGITYGMTGRLYF